MTQIFSVVEIFGSRRGGAASTLNARISGLMAHGNDLKESTLEHSIEISFDLQNNQDFFCTVLDWFKAEKEADFDLRMRNGKFSETRRTVEIKVFNGEHGDAAVHALLKDAVLSEWKIVPLAAGQYQVVVRVQSCDMSMWSSAKWDDPKPEGLPDSESEPTTCRLMVDQTGVSQWERTFEAELSGSIGESLDLRLVYDYSGNSRKANWIKDGCGRSFVSGIELESDKIKSLDFQSSQSRQNERIVFSKLRFRFESVAHWLPHIELLDVVLITLACGADLNDLGRVAFSGEGRSLQAKNQRSKYQLENALDGPEVLTLELKNSSLSEEIDDLYSALECVYGSSIDHSVQLIEMSPRFVEPFLVASLAMDSNQNLNFYFSPRSQGQDVSKADQNLLEFFEALSQGHFNFAALKGRKLGFEDFATAGVPHAPEYPYSTYSGLSPVFLKLNFSGHHMTGLVQGVSVVTSPWSIQLTLSMRCCSVSGGGEREQGSNVT